MIRPTGTPSGLNVLREDLPLPLCVLRGAALAAPLLPHLGKVYLRLLGFTL